MQEVNIFIQTGIKSIRPADGAAGYLLEAQTEKGPATLSRIYTIKDATVHAAELSVLIEAVKRIKEPCSLTVFTDSTYIAAAVENGWLEGWAANDWKTSRGKNVANRELWEELRKLLRTHTATFTREPGEYSSWLKCEVERKERIYV